MSDIHFSTVPFEVRAEIAEAHRAAWERLAAPGNWWTGAERVALASEVRQAEHCACCCESRESRTPAAAALRHDSVTDLPDAAIDVVHRVVTDPGGLNRGWYQQKLDEGLSDAQYVEIIGVVVTLVSIDTVCRGLGEPLHPLPRPVSGEPSGYRPAQARLEEAWVPMIPGGGAVGREADLWRLRRTGNVIRAMSLVPDAVRQLMELSDVHYLPPDRIVDLRAGRAIDRAQIELVAGRVSALNECFY